MKIENNTVIPDTGRLLKTSRGIYSEVALGLTKAYENGQLVTFENTLDDIKEITPVRIFDNVYYVEEKTYSKLVTELIRLKYSLDDELALQANFRLNPNSEEEQNFLNWRVICKQVAKSLVNE